MDFNFQNITSTEFGLYLEFGDQSSHALIPVDDRVQEALTDMLNETIARFENIENIEDFDVSQKYGSYERLRCPVNSPLMQNINALYQAENIPTNANHINNVESIVYYFAIFRDNQNRKLVAIRRASYFKGILCAHNKLIRWIDDSLQIVEDNIFKLDKDFDFLADNQFAYILKPNNFEFIAGIDKYTTEQINQVVQDLHDQVTNIDFAHLNQYIIVNRRASRLAISLKSRDDLHETSASELRRECRQKGIEINTRNGRIRPRDGHELAFLQLLDRRRYDICLIDGEKEIYEAANRKKLP